MEYVVKEKEKVKIFCIPLYAFKQPDGIDPKSWLFEKSRLETSTIVQISEISKLSEVFLIES